jgi:hypothetical protein
MVNAFLAFNDLFIGASTHISAKYKITYNNNIETIFKRINHFYTKGSTGWLSSILICLMVLQYVWENLKPKTKQDNELLFAVREPFQSVRTQIGITSGIIK